MARTNRIGQHKTTVSTDNGITRVVYHVTPVVKIDWEKRIVTLNTGGWSTVTTKLRMNQASNQFDLGFHVYQKDWNWFVTVPHPEKETNGDTQTGWTWTSRDIPFTSDEVSFQF